MPWKNKKTQRYYISLKNLISIKKELHKTCFAHDVSYVDRKDLPKRTASDKVLKQRT